METVLWILLWGVGWFVMYGLIYLLFRDEMEWNNNKRSQAAFWSLFSWLGIVVVIFLAVVVGASCGGSWLAKKIVTPPLEKYENLVEKLEAKMLKLFEKRTN